MIVVVVFFFVVAAAVVVASIPIQTVRALQDRAVVPRVSKAI